MRLLPNKLAMYTRMMNGETFEGATLAHPAPNVTIDGRRIAP